MAVNEALVAFCADVLNPYKVLDKDGEPAKRSLRIVGADRKVRASAIPMVDGEGITLSAEQLAGAIMARAQPLLEKGEDLRVELMRTNDNNPSDHCPLSPTSTAIATTRKMPLEILNTMIDGKANSLIIADPIAQLAAVLAAVTLGQNDHAFSVIHRAMDANKALSLRLATAEGRATRAEADLRWHKATEPLVPTAIAEVANDEQDPAWRALLRTIDALKGPLAVIAEAGASAIRSASGAPHPAPRPEPVPPLPTGAEASRDGGAPAPASAPPPAAQDDGIPFDEIPAAVDQLSEALIALLLARPDLIPTAVPKLIPVLDAGGPLAEAALRAYLASKTAVATA